MKQFKKGYISIIELLVVTAIIVVLTAIVLINYPAAKKQLALQRSASRLVQDIRRVQEMAVASEPCPVGWPCAGQISAGGYGINLSKTSPKDLYYILFADVDSSETYGPGAEKIGDEIYFESGIQIKNLPSSNVNIIFVPPDPTTHLTDQEANPLGNQISIVISLIDDPTKTKTIIINKAGLIYVE